MQNVMQKVHQILSTMNIIKPSFAIILDTRNKTKDGLYPLKIRVTFNRQSRMYGIGRDLTEEQFNKLFSSKLRDEFLKEIRVHSENIKKNAIDVSDKIRVFSFEKFRNAFIGNSSNSEKTDDVYKNLELYISTLQSEGRVSTASTYECTLKSLKRYKKKLTFEEITVKFLNDYEKWMLNSGNSITTVGIYLRSLRAIFNQAIDNGVINKDSYPFRKKLFQIAAGRNIKKALSVQNIHKIFEYPTIYGSSVDKAKDFWMFSYLCNGLNVKDICRLKWKDIDGDKLIVIRAKTANTSKSNQKIISIFLNDKALEIIDKWSCDRKLNSYVFPILEENPSPQRERDLVQHFTKFINKYMKRIGKELGFEKPLTTYVARHSFSTVLKRGGAPIEYIAEALGHSSLKTTESYLDSFEDDVKRKYNDLLVQFTK